MRRYWQDLYGAMHEIEVPDDAVSFAIGAWCPTCHPEQNPMSMAPQRIVMIDYERRRFACGQRLTDERMHEFPSPLKIVRIKPVVTPIVEIEER